MPQLKTARRHLSISSFFIGLPVVCLSQLSIAQGLDAEQSDENGRVEEILVQGRNYVPNQVSVGKGRTAINDIAQTVNVITRQRIEDQNLITLTEVMQQTTGATVVPADGAGLNPNYYSRGYFIDAIMLDGLPEIDTTGTGLSTNFDTAIYESVEILKGPAGLFLGAGEPGALLNLVRKRAQAAPAVSGIFTSRSWDHYRAQVDVTGGLNDSGSIRGRAVAVYDEGDSFRDIINHEKAVFYGTLEFDLSPSTVLYTSITHQDIESVMDYGLPAFADGRLLDVSTSTFVGADWNQLDPVINDVTIGLEHEFADGSLLKLAGRNFDRDLDGLGAFSRSAVDPDTGDVSLTTLGFSSERDGEAYDIYYDKPFMLAGLEHNFVIGADHRTAKDESVFLIGPRLTQNVFNTNHALPGPIINFEFPTDPVETEQSGVYTQARFGLNQSLKLVLGGRMTWWDTRNLSASSGEVNSENNVDGEFTPFAALLWQGLENHTLYGSYAEIFQPQAAVTIQNEPLPPRTGEQFEVGIKGEYLDGALISHLALFMIEDVNRAINDPNALPGVGASLAAGEVHSEGLEIELNGRVLPRMNLTAGYAYTRTKFERGNVDEQGNTFSTFTPRHIFNFWANYQLPADSLEKMDLGLGLRHSSSFYSENGGVRFEADDFTVVQARVGYAFNDRMSLSLLANNLFDETYYQKVAAATRQNYFGEPRSYSLILNAKF